MPTDATQWFREPGRGKYARRERERRFLTRASPPVGTASRFIEDYYLRDMRLRLRRVTGEGQSIHKLTQKVRTVQSDPSEVLITNMYLSEVEYARLSALPGRMVVKNRSVVEVASHHFVVDDFQGPLQGLQLAEVEVRDLAEPLDLPEWLGVEVTDDDRFSGGNLSATDEVRLSQILDSL